MHLIRRVAVAVAALPLALSAGCATTPSATAGHPAAAPALVELVREPVTILIGIDGAHPDYLKRGATPVLSRLAAEGASASMQPSFPTKTFPNFWTIATGMRPDRNGIVGNSMVDPTRPDERFTLATDDPFWWNAAEPIWVAAEKAGIRSATMFWPGSNVAWGSTGKPDHGVYPGGNRASDWQQFSQAITADQRVDAVVDWLRRPADTRPRFLTLYFDDVDTAGHANGPDAPETTAAMTKVDTAIGRLLAQLELLRQPANLVIVADHGMATVSGERSIALDAISPPDDYRVIESGPYASIEPVAGREDAVAKALSKPHQHMQCWPKAKIPARLAYGTNRRVPSWLCLAETGWVVLPGKSTRTGISGAHGYDNAEPQMQAMFVANGPAFRRGVALPSFRNTAIHPLLRRLLGIASNSSLDADASVFDRAIK